nr:MAG TPA: hypothetical protein [Caudoviricetes sp.]
MLENSKFPKSFQFRINLNKKRKQKASENRVKTKHQTLFRNNLDNRNVSNKRLQRYANGKVSTFYYQARKTAANGK